MVKAKTILKLWVIPTSLVNIIYSFSKLLNPESDLQEEEPAV